MSTDCSPHLPRRPDRWVHGRSLCPQAGTPSSCRSACRAETHSGVKCMASHPSHLTAPHAPARGGPTREHPPTATSNIKSQLHSGSRQQASRRRPHAAPRVGPQGRQRPRTSPQGAPGQCQGGARTHSASCWHLPGARPGGDQVSQARGEACRLPTGNQHSAGQVHDRTSREGRKFRKNP